MVTCDLNNLVEPIHPKAMITILASDDIDIWMRGSYNESVAHQRPFGCVSHAYQRSSLPPWLSPCRAQQLGASRGVKHRD